MTKEESRELTLQDLMEEMGKITKISRLQEEDNVLRSLIRGQTRSQILRDLQEKYPKEDFKRGDVEEFLIAYKDVFMDEAKRIQTAAGRRMMKQQEGLTNELIDLALTTKRLVNKFEDQEDNTNTVGALRVAADIFMKVGKVQGIFNEGPEINVNMKMDKIVSEITSNDSEFKKKIRSIVSSNERVIDAEVQEDE